MPKITGTVGKGGTNAPADVRTVQQLLNRFRPQPMRLLRLDGRIGYLTIAAIEDFQRRTLKGFAHPDGLGLVAPAAPTFNALAGCLPQVDVIAWATKVSSAFKMKVLSICQELEMCPDFLMSAMAFESAESFRADIKNAAGSGAVGLIQFLSSTAKALGTTTEALAKLTPEQQLEYVKKYFQPKRGRLQTIEDLYMAILYPAAVGKAPESTLFNKGTTAYRQNAGLDTNRDGKITITEAVLLVRAEFEKGLRPGFIG